MASKQGEESSGSESEEIKDEIEPGSSGQKAKTSLAAKAANIFRTVKSKISPRKGKDEPLINPPTPSPDCSESSSSKSVSPSSLDLCTVSSVGTEFMTDTTSAPGVPGRSDSLSEVPEIRDSQGKESTSEEKLESKGDFQA